MPSDEEQETATQVQEDDEDDLEAKRSLCDRFIVEANKTITKIMHNFGNDSHFNHS